MDRKWTQLLFAVGGIVVYWLLYKSGEWIWGYFGRPNTMQLGTGAFVLGAIVTYVCWKNARLSQLADEVVGELSKVTWPNRQEVTQSTLVVIMTTIIASGVLGVFDGMWAWVTRQIYG